MPRRIKTIGSWGGKYSASQLSDILKNHRGEFLELCKRVTCDECAADNLFDLVEKFLESSQSKDSLDVSSTQELLNAVKYNAAKKPGSLMICSSPEDSKNMDLEVNLIQLLAEVHLMSVGQTNRR